MAAGGAEEGVRSRIGAVALGALLLLGALQVAARRHHLWLDALSYLDLAGEVLAGDWRQALHLYWSPLYPLALALGLALIGPAPGREILVVKAVDLAFFALAAVSLHILLATLAGDDERRERWLWLGGGCALSGWAALVWSGADKDTPDLALAALVYAAAALLVQLRRGAPERRTALALGLVLGLAYWVKAAALPSAAGFVAAALAGAPSRRGGLTRAACVLSGLLLAAGPLVAGLSVVHRRPTIGDSGRLNFAWYVSPGGIADEHWQGEPPGSGRPLHPTRRLATAPPLYEFATPVAGTYPPWYDPAYWNAGLTPVLDPVAVAASAGRNLVFVARRLGFLLLLALLFLAAAIRRRGLGALLRSARAELLLPGAAGLALYVAAIDLTWLSPTWGAMQMRLVAPFLVLLVAGAYQAARRHPDPVLRRLAAALAMTAAVAAAVPLIGRGGGAARSLAAGSDPVAWRVAAELGRRGLRRGQAVALVGQQDAYWARLAGLRVIAEAPDVAAFWAALPGGEDRLLGLLAGTGAVAVVATPRSASAAAAAGWTPLGGTGYSVRLLAPPPGGEPPPRIP